MPSERDAMPFIVLTDEELAYFRYVCALFPLPESPLRHIGENDTEPSSLESIFDSLHQKGFVLESGEPAPGDFSIRLSTVAECGARVSLTLPTEGDETRREFYLACGRAVEYRAHDGVHEFGVPKTEAELANEIHRLFKAKPQVSMTPLELSAGEYLVFAVLARDVRANSEAGGGESSMSVEEVLAYFDEPETKYVRTPSDESWNASVKALCKKDVLVSGPGGYELHPSFHALARELIADNQQTIARYDFLDETWLVREVHLYPTSDSIYRLGTRADGAALVEELSSALLLRRVASIVMTLPNILATAGQPAPTK